MRIVDINQLLEIGSRVMPEDEFRGFETTATQLAHNLALRLSEGDKTIYYDPTKTELEPGFGGLCACFLTGNSTSELAEELRQADPGGEE